MIQIIAVGKGSCTDLLNRAGNNHPAHSRIGKGILADKLQTFTNGKADWLIPIHIAHRLERLCTDTGNTITDDNCSDLVCVFTPGGNVFRSAIIIHVTGTGDGQNTIVQSPGQIITAGSGRNRFGCRHHRGLIAAVSQLQNTGLAPQVQGLIVIGKPDITAGCIESIARGCRTLSSGQEQAAVKSGSTVITVGDIHQIVFAIQSHSIPHMQPCTGSAAHAAGDGIAVNATGFVTQVLEGLGIALADHPGAGISVKNPDQLPGVGIQGERAGAGRRIIVGYQIADFIPEAHQLVIGGSIPILGRNGLGVFRRSNRRSCHGGIHHGGIFAVARTLHVLHNPEQQSQLGNLQISVVQILESHSGQSSAGICLLIVYFIEPVQFIRAVMQQGRNDRIDGQQHKQLVCCLIHSAAGALHTPGCQSAVCHRKGGGSQLTGCHFDNLCLQKIIQLLLNIRQFFPGSRAENGRTVVIEEVLQIQLKSKFIVLIVCINRNDLFNGNHFPLCSRLCFFCCCRFLRERGLCRCGFLRNR